MKRWVLKACSVFALTLLVAAMLNPAAGADPGDPPRSDFFDLSDVRVPVVKHPKLDSVLYQLANAQVRADAGAFAETRGIYLKEDRVRVIIESDPAYKDNAISLAEALGTEIETSYENLIQALVPIACLETIANDSSVKWVRLPFQALAESITSEGVSIINANRFHNAGFTGAGVKVGILDSGFSGHAALLGTELPPTVTTRWGTSIGGPGTSVHGTACAEIVYDLAPGAQFYLANFGTDVEWGNAVSWLMGQGVNVISCSMGWAYTGPGNGSGVIDDAVAAARGAGILWSQSAGNYATQHWSGVFTDPNGDNTHEFNTVSHDHGNTIHASAGDIISAFLRWDDQWGSSSNDYDLYLVNSRTGTAVAASTNPQNGTAGSIPREGLSYVAATTDDYFLGIVRYSAVRNANFDMLNFNQALAGC